MADEKEIIRVSEINPVDFYNKAYKHDMFTFMCNMKGITMTSADAFSVIKNVSDAGKRMVVLEGDYYVPKMENGLGLTVDYRYTPFMMLQKFRFKDRFELAVHYVVIELMHNVSDYIRVGYKYHKVTTKLDRNDIIRTELSVWDKMTILDDFGKSELEIIPKYDSFTMVPDNKSHTRVVGNNYNLYSPFSHEPCSDEEYKGFEGWKWSKRLLEHIFGEDMGENMNDYFKTGSIIIDEDENQYLQGLKYMKILYDLPKQILPILVLTSQERETGKSTFIDWLCILFGDNAVVVNPQDISNSFNGTYSDKNIIAIEESRFEGTQTLEKLKALATQKKLTVNTKFIAQYSVPFYGKLIITSNDENKFSRVESAEIRYWVRRIPSLVGKANHDILRDLTNEIPQFLYYLNTLPEPNIKGSRMAYYPSELWTKALNTVKEESLPALHKDIIILLDDHAANNRKIEVFKFTAKAMKLEFFGHNNNIEINYINRILKDSIKLNKGNPEMQRHIPFETDLSQHQKKISGRVYEFINPYFNKDLDDTYQTKDKF